MDCGLPFKGNAEANGSALKPCDGCLAAMRAMNGSVWNGMIHPIKITAKLLSVWALLAWFNVACLSVVLG